MTLENYKMFLRWLKDKNLFGQFTKEIRERGISRIRRITVIDAQDNNREVSIDDNNIFKYYCLTSCAPSDVIMNAIDWSKSSLGTTVWATFYNEYKEYYRGKVIESCHNYKKLHKYIN